MKTPKVATRNTPRPLNIGGWFLAVLALPAILLLSATPLRAEDRLVETMGDSIISSEVKTALLYHLSFNFQVRTHDGIVTLSGSAVDSAEKDLNSKIAARISGVKRVINEMIIPTAVGTNN